MFMHTMNNWFSNMLDFGAAVLLDNIFVHSCTVKKHFILLKKVLACLHQYNFYYNLKKCSFLCNSTMFLGFDVPPKGMQVSDLKVQSLNEWPVPTMVK